MSDNKTTIQKLIDDSMIIYHATRKFTSLHELYKNVSTFRKRLIEIERQSYINLVFPSPEEIIRIENEYINMKKEAAYIMAEINSTFNKINW